MTKKVSFTKSEEFKFVKNITTGSDSDTIVHYRTIEVTDINPSELEMSIRKFVGLTQHKPTYIPLVDFRTLFVKEDNKYILDVYGLSRFLDLTISSMEEVSFRSIENTLFKVEVFYMIEDSEDYNLHSQFLAQTAAELL